MDETEVCPYSVEDFLAKERKKLNEDQKTLELILTLLKDEQQIHSSPLHDGNVQVEFARDKITQEVNNPNNVGTLKKARSYNSQVEKERLAYLFENAPNSLYVRMASKTHRNRERRKLSKENQDPSYFSSRSRNLASENETNGTNNNVPKKVRMCLSSPSYDSDRSLRGFGEYEGRRSAFLEKKKQEYMEYLSNMKKNRMLQRSRSRKMESQDEGYGSENRDNLSPSTESHEDTKWNHRWIRIQQENYRKELDKQIEEKKILEEERRNREISEYERSKNNDVKWRQNLMKHIEEDFHKRLKVLNDCKRENEVEKKNDTQRTCRDFLSPRCENDLSRIRDETSPSRIIHGQKSHESNNTFAKQSIETCSINDMNAYEKMKKELYKRELTKQMEEKRFLENEKNDGCRERGKEHQRNAEIPLYLRNPFMKQNAESCTIDNLEEYQRMRSMEYKKELDKQIEEKRKLERECKAKTEKADQKLEERLRRDEEKRLKENHENEVSVVQNGVHPKAFHETKPINTATSKFPSKSLVKSRSISSTDSKFNEKAPMKNVSFAPRTYVYSFKNDEKLDHIPKSESSTEDRNNYMARTNDSIIIEAPYVLASKNVPDFIDPIDHCGGKRLKFPTSPEHLPISSNTSKPLPEIAKLPIPSAVSMSEQAIQQYFKTSAFSDLSKIRRMLRDRNNNIN